MVILQNSCSFIFRTICLEKFFSMTRLPILNIFSKYAEASMMYVTATHLFLILMEARTTSDGTSHQVNVIFIVSTMNISYFRKKEDNSHISAVSFFLFFLNQTKRAINQWRI